MTHFSSPAWYTNGTMRHFTLASAQALLPEVERLLRQAIRGKQAYQEAEAESLRIQRQVEITGGMRIDIAGSAALRKRREEGAAALNQAMEAIQELGVQVKDLEIGLIDFPTWYRGEEVLLCWRLGEAGIGHWHGLSDGFRGRKAIDRDFLDHHRGDPPE
jgi:hypothetical protein